MERQTNVNTGFLMKNEEYYLTFYPGKALLKSYHLFAPRPAPSPLKESFYAQNRIESTFNRIGSGQLILVFLIKIILKKFFFFLFESTSIRLKKIANRSPLHMIQFFYFI